MPEKLSALRELCFQRTARLLKRSYWNPELPLDHNPFALLPSTVIDMLIIYVTRISIREPLLSSDIRLLLTSGRVREFILDKDENDPFNHINVTDFNLQKILIDLLPSSHYVITVKIRSLGLLRGNSPVVTPALNCLLREAQNVKHVESVVEFDLRVLSNSFQLEKLVLHFALRNLIHDFLKFDGQFNTHASLKYLETLENERISYLDIAIILDHCTELVYINHDISKSLEHRHANELHSGCLTHKYKIQKCFLGYFDNLGMNFAVASSCGVRIAASTCPYLQELKIAVNDDELISAVSHFRNLINLNIQWQPYPFPDFAATVQPVLEKQEIGRNLKTLELGCFTDVDFSVIGMCCPNLEVLKIYYYEECTCSTYSPDSFRKLQVLSLLNSEEYDCKKNTLVGILSSATNLKEVIIKRAGELTDAVLEDILKENSLSELKILDLVKPGLTLNGWQNLACSLTALKILSVYEPNFSFKECKDAICEINPRITVYWEID